MPRTAVYLISWFAFVVAAVAFVSRFTPVVNHAVLLVSALSPYLMLGAVVSAVLLLITGPWWAAAPAIVRRSEDGLSREVPAARAWSFALALVPAALAARHSSARHTW